MPLCSDCKAEAEVHTTHAGSEPSRVMQLLAGLVGRDSTPSEGETCDRCHQPCDECGG